MVGVKWRFVARKVEKRATMTARTARTAMTAKDPGATGIRQGPTGISPLSTGMRWEIYNWKLVNLVNLVY